MNKRGGAWYYKPIQKALIWCAIFVTTYTGLSYANYQTATSLPLDVDYSITVYKRFPHNSQVEKKIELNQVQSTAILGMLSRTEYRGFYLFSPRKRAKSTYYDIWVVSASTNYSAQFLIGEEFSYSWGDFTKVKLGNTEEILKTLDEWNREMVPLSEDRGTVLRQG